MYFLKSKIEADNKAVHVTLVRKTLSLNKEGLSDSEPLESSLPGGQKFSLCRCPFPTSGPEPKQRLDPGISQCGKIQPVVVTPFPRKGSPELDEWIN